MDMQKEREAFEEWVKAETSLNLTHTDDAGYFSPITFYAFEAWQAAKASAVPDGYCVVPKNPTNSMAHAGKEIDGRLSAFKCADIYKAMIEAAQEKEIV